MSEKCKCGLTLPRIRIMGRKRDSVTVGIKGTRLFPSQIYKALYEFDEITGDFQLVLDSEHRKDILTFRVEVVKESNVNSKDLELKIKKKLENMFPDFKDCVTKDLIEVKIELLNPNSLPKTGAGKPKDIIIDNRVLV